MERWHNAQKRVGWRRCVVWGAECTRGVDGSRSRGEGAPCPWEWHEREILVHVWSSTSCFKTVCFNVCKILYFFSRLFSCIVPYKYVFNFSLLRCYLYNFGVDDWCWNNDFLFPPNSFTKMQVKREQNRIERERVKSRLLKSVNFS